MCSQDADEDGGKKRYIGSQEFWIVNRYERPNLVKLSPLTNIRVQPFSHPRRAFERELSGLDYIRLHSVPSVPCIGQTAVRASSGQRVPSRRNPRSLSSSSDTFIVRGRILITSSFRR